MSQYLGQNIAQVCIHNWSQLAGSEYVQLHSTVSICSYIQPTNQPTNLPTYQPTNQWTSIQTWDATQVVLPEIEKNRNPESHIWLEKQWKTTVSYGFLMFLVDFYFKPVLETTGGLSWTTALRRTCRKPQRSGGQFCELEGQVCRNSLVFGTKNMCMLSFFNCIQSQFIGFSFFSGDCSWRPVEFGRNRNNNTQDYILRYLSYIQ